MKHINDIISESKYPCEGGISGTTQKLDVQLTGRLEEDVNRIMETLLYTYENYKSDGHGYFDSSKFKREYLYTELENYMKNNK